MSTLSLFPHLTDADFDQACYALSHAFEQQGDSSGEWQSVHVIDSAATTLVRITKSLSTTQDLSANVEMTKQDYDGDDDEEDYETEEILQDDPEALDSTSAPCSPTVDYDMLLSPTYRVPVLYISINDVLHRYPPTLDTLYRHLVPEALRSQTQSVGVIGGITITHHPLTDRPVFFIHPCRTAEVMEASIGESRRVTAQEYLMVWIGALGKSVGLKLPLRLAQVMLR